MKNSKFHFSFKKYKKKGFYHSVKKTGNERLSINLIPASKYDKNDKEIFHLLVNIKGNKQGLIYLAKKIIILAFLQDKNGYHVYFDQESDIIKKDSLEFRIEFENSDERLKQPDNFSKAYQNFIKKRNKSFKKLSKEFNEDLNRISDKVIP